MAVRRVQTKNEIKALLAGAGIKPRRRWGQNFLIDGNLMRRLLENAEISEEDLVLEVGIGTGGLTEHLVEAAGAVVAAEIDPALCRIVAGRLQGAENLLIVRGDVLRDKHHLADGVLAALRAGRARCPGRLMLVANLPYSVATPLLMDLLLSDLGFSRLCFTVQREVADRIVAQAGARTCGPLSIIVQATCDVRRLAVLPPSVFWPAPKVESSMLRLDVARNPFETPAGLSRFAEFVRGGFGHRRKTLRSNLMRTLGESACRRLESTLDLTRRPEALTVEEWIRLEAER